MSKSWPFNQIHHTLWRSKRVRSLDDSDHKLLLLWMMTCEHQNALGFFRCPDQWPAADLQWDVSRVTESRKHLTFVGLIYYDEETEEVYVDQWMRFAVKPAPKVMQGYRRQVGDIESDTIREVVEQDFLNAEDRWTGDAPPAPSASRPASDAIQISPQLAANLSRKQGTGY
ncbi:hypothetical protein [Neorhizobium sp. T25_13]|uniref:hypothetical protein n=1 Tax=Neorhizobium sp. T25_13 TaxID=2093830 RepID=UPI000CFA0354|nr:hypothetical protein [Neorhizobium sp. T25_13]